jgi:hypothetical protein
MPFLDFFYVSLLCSTLVLSSHQIGIIIGNLTLLNTNSLLNTDNIHPVGASMGLTMMTVWENSDLLGNGESLYFSLYTLGLWSPGVLILGTAGASQAAIVSSSSSYYLAYTSSSATIQLTTTVAGVLWTPPVTFPQMFTSIQNQYPSLALDNANNQLVLVWQAHVSGLSNSDILFSRSNDGGVTWSNTTVLNSNALSSPYSNINPFVLCTTPSISFVSLIDDDVTLVRSLLLFVFIFFFSFPVIGLCLQAIGWSFGLPMIRSMARDPISTFSIHFPSTAVKFGLPPPFLTPTHKMILATICFLTSRTADSMSPLFGHQTTRVR